MFLAETVNPLVQGLVLGSPFLGRALLDEATNPACLTYVDLNPIRANMAETPGESHFTSAFERIKCGKTRLEIPPKPSDPISFLGKPGEWLGPIHEEYGEEREGLLSLNWGDYLEVLDWTGRLLVQGKKLNSRGYATDPCSPGD